MSNYLCCFGECYCKPVFCVFVILCCLELFANLSVYIHDILVQRRQRNSSVGLVGLSFPFFRLLRKFTMCLPHIHNPVCDLLACCCADFFLPSSVLQTALLRYCAHDALSNCLKGLFTQTSSGCTFEVHPPGMIGALVLSGPRVS